LARGQLALFIKNDLLKYRGPFELKAVPICALAAFLAPINHVQRDNWTEEL
jgi:hypothetical protein